MKLIKDKVKWEKAKKNALKDIKNKYFWIYTLIMIVLGVLFFIIKSSTARIICLGGFIIVQLIYNIKYEKTKKEKYLGWAYIVMFSFYFAIYTSMSVKEFNIIIWLILIFGYLVLGYFTIKSFLDLKRSKQLWEVTLNYILLSVYIVILFGAIFTITNIKEENQILNYAGEKIVGIWNHISFSAENFYTSNFGEHPFGLSKYISYLEMMISMIIHVIVIGSVVNNLSKNKKKKK